MMLFTIIEPFSPADGAMWDRYCSWRGIRFERFDSIDGMLRKNLFDTPEDEDWSHIVNDHFQLHLITDFTHALKKYSQIGRGEIVGVKFDHHEPRHEGFLGFDIIDGHFNISLLANWGNDLNFINDSLASNALLRDLETAREIHQRLEQDFSDDGHVQGSRIASIYRVQNVGEFVKNY